jgi:hypothetical protein
VSPARTPKSHTEAANAVVGETLRAYKLDTGYTYAQLAAAVGRDASLVGDWVSDAKPVPMWLLAHPGVPEKLRARFVAIAVRSEGASAPIERTSSLLAGAAATAIGVIVEALADNKLTAAERVVARPVIRVLRDRCNAWLTADEEAQ